MRTLTNFEITEYLALAGIKNSPQVQGGADWSVPAWSVGRGLYICADDDGEEFTLLRRDESTEDECVPLAFGALAHVVAFLVAGVLP